MTPTANLDVFSGTRASGRTQHKSGDRNQAAGGASAGPALARRRNVTRPEPTADHDEDDFQPFRAVPLETLASPASQSRRERCSLQAQRCRRQSAPLRRAAGRLPPARRIAFASSACRRGGASTRSPAAEDGAEHGRACGPRPPRISASEANPRPRRKSAGRQPRTVATARTMVKRLDGFDQRSEEGRRDGRRWVAQVIAATSAAQAIVVAAARAINRTCLGRVSDAIHGARLGRKGSATRISTPSGPRHSGPARWGFAGPAARQRQTRRGLNHGAMLAAPIARLFRACP